MLVTVKLLIFIEALQLLAFGLFWACLKNEARRLIRPLDVALALAIPVVGLFGRDKNVFYAFMVVVPLLSIGKPAKLVQRYLLVLPLFPALTQNYLVGGLYLGDVSAIDALNLGALTALLFTRGTRRKAVTAIDAMIWVIFVLSLLMETRGVPINGILRASFTTMLAIAPPFYLIARLVSTHRMASDAIVFMTLGAFCNAIVAAFESVRGWPLYQAFNEALNVPMGLSATLSIRAGFLRAQGAVANPTTLGLILALGFITTLALRPRIKPGGRVILLGLFAAGTISSQSRGAWIALALGVALYLLYERRTTLLIGILSVSAMAAVAIGVLAPDNSKVAHLVGRSGAAEMTADYRKNLLSRGLQEIAAHPLTGQTRAQLEVSMNDMRQGEHIIDYVNTPLTVALTSGLGGFALYLLAWFVPMFAGWNARNRRGAHDIDAPVALPFAMIGACMTCLLFTSTIDRMIPIAMVSMGLMSAYLRLTQIDKAGTRTGAGRIRRSLVARVPRADDPQPVY